MCCVLVCYFLEVTFIASDIKPHALGLDAPRDRPILFRLSILVRIFDTRVVLVTSILHKSQRAHRRKRELLKTIVRTK